MGMFTVAFIATISVGMYFDSLNKRTKIEYRIECIKAKGKMVKDECVTE